MRRQAPLLAAAGLLLLAPLARAQEVAVDSETFSGLEARSIGPATMSGRVTAIDAVAGDRLTVWVGAADGGVWKSTDGGVDFKPVFDKNTQSIGAIAVDPKDPKTVWVGTGETWTRNSVSVGDGVYRTTDGGDNWESMGLKDSERIARIAVDPKDSQVVYVCASGHLFDANSERGVYRTADGGKSWKAVLSVNNETGCADLAVDPQDPKVVYAAMWQFRRWPYFFKSGGPGSGLYKSADGGATWTRLSKGLPAGELGRIALAVAPSNPKIVYASIEAKKTSLYRSEDQGASWTALSSSTVVSARPFYFSRLVVDPKNAERVYKAGTGMGVSDDGGKTFAGVGGGGLFGASYHSDVHAIWLNPGNPEELLLGCDGGVYQSRDRGNHWRFVGSLPLSQFYHVSYDMEWPYNVYGGLQDNSTWMGPSRKSGGAIMNRDWKVLGFGDGFWAFVDASDPDLVYVEFQGGNLLRQRKSTGEIKDIRPYEKEGEDKYRFNWNTPIHLSPTRPGTLYYGAQFLFRSSDHGESWTRISGDLTSNDKNKLKQDESGGLTLDNSTAENHCTIYVIAESPKNADMVWVGTDDGNLQLTRDGGKTWTNVTPTPAAGLPKATWVSNVEPSHFDPATAYATFDGHMTGDMKSYVYRTTDSGKTWQSLAAGDVKGYAHVIREDLVNRELLFLGTELGLFVSLDGGKQWGQFSGRLPKVAIRDIAIHPRESDLLLATHGRGIYIVDDITPLRKLTAEVLNTDVAFLESRPSVMPIPAFDFRFEGDGEYEGRSLEDSAFITYYLKKRHMFGDLKLEIYDEKGTLLSTIPGGKRRGINRVAWPMSEKGPKVPAAAVAAFSPGAFSGPRVPEGVYTVKMIKGKDTYSSQLKLVLDPRNKTSAEDRALKQQTVRKLYGLLTQLTYVVEALVDTRDALRSRAEGLPAGDLLRHKLEGAADTLEKQRAAIVSTRQGEGISGEEKLREQLVGLYGGVNFYEGRPTNSQVERMGVLAKQLDAAGALYKATCEKELPAVNAQAEKQKLQPVKPLSYEDWQARQKPS
jgi:photosystem II stability/assembly factor-like uncharacterized protein